MPKYEDIDDQHDLTDHNKFREAMKREDEASKAPCFRCHAQNGCDTPAYCDAYQKWRKKYLRNKLR